MAPHISPWMVLGVHRKNTLEEIHETYKQLALQHHPDRGGSVEKFQAVNSAYQLLRDRKRTQDYLNQLVVRGKPCVDCKGAGVYAKSKGLTGKVYQLCSPCGGTGYIIKAKKEKEHVIELQSAKMPRGTRRDNKRKT